MTIKLAAAAALLVAAPAAAQTVDGIRDASYGAPKSTVTYLPGAPTSNFGAPTPFSEATGYNIYLTSDANAVYGFLQTTVPGGTGAGTFANLYFDLDPANGNGSDIGFEITNDRAFVAGGNPGEYASNLAGLNFATSSDGTGIEFSIANSLFTGPIAGLDYMGFTGFAAPGGTVTLRLSQSFNYAVAGGPTYGDNRLGAVTIGGAATGAVPEPASWAMMIVGFGLAGAAVRRRKAAAPAFA